MEERNWLFAAMSILGPVLAFIAAELSRRYSDARKEGAKEHAADTLAAEFSKFREKTELALSIRAASEGTINSLALEFHEFKADMKESVKTLFDKIDKFLAEGGYPCRQVGAIAGMQTQINANTARLDRIQLSVRDIERRLLQRSPLMELGEGSTEET